MTFDSEVRRVFNLPAGDGKQQARCTGPFSDARCCPVHAPDARQATQPSQYLAQPLGPFNVEDAAGRPSHASGELGRDTVTCISEIEREAYQRGQRAIATKVLHLCKTMNESNVWANRNEVMEMCEEVLAK